MAERLLTLADVYKPMTVNDMLNAQSAAMQNKLAQLQMNELQKKLSKDEQVQNVLRDLYAPAQPQIGTPAQPQQGTGANITLDSGTGTTGNYFQQALGGNRPKMSLGNFNAQMPSPDYQSAQPASPDYRPAVPDGINPAAIERLRQVDPERAIQMQHSQTEEQQKRAAFAMQHFYKPQIDNATRNGDQGALDKIYDSLNADPAFKGMSIPKMTTSGPGNISAPVTVTPDKPMKNPLTGEDLEPGTYQVERDKGKVKITPIKPETGAHNTVTKMVNGKPMIYQFNPQTNRYDIPIGEAPKAGINLNTPTDEQSSRLADRLGYGKASLKDIPARGMARTNIMDAFFKEFPDGDFNKAEANIKYIQNPQNMKTRAYVKTLLPRYEQLRQKAAAMKNSDMVAFNKVVNWWSQQTGRPEVVDFNSLKNALVQEAESAMTGGQAVTDTRLRMGVENIQHANSPAQLSVAIDNYENALKAKSEAASDIPYPWEEVRGETTGKTTNAPEAGGAVKTADDLLKKYGY